MSDELMTKASEIGAQHGKNAVSWMFDGNTPSETFFRYARGINDGDPEIMDALPVHGLSGEYADGYSARDLERELGINPADETTDFGDICDAYESAFNSAVESEIIRHAQYHADNA